MVKWKTSSTNGITKASLKSWQRTVPTIYTGGVDKKQAGWTMDMGDKGQEDLTWLID